MTTPISNVPDFTPGQKPTAEDLNALKNAVLAVFSGGIDADSLSWPIVAQGILDMNGNDIINVASTGGVIAVNATNTFTDAVSAVNAAGSGTILIDAGVSASVDPSGDEITASDVLILGRGPTSVLNVGGNGSLLCSGDNITFKDMLITTSAPGTYTDAIVFSGEHGGMDNVHFNGLEVHGIRLGATSAVGDRAIGTKFSRISCTGNKAYLFRMYNCQNIVIEGTVGLDFDAAGAGGGILFDAGASRIQKVIIDGVIIDTDFGSGIESGLGAASSSFSEVSISNVNINCLDVTKHGLNTHGLQQSSVVNSTVYYKVQLSGAQNKFIGNVFGYTAGVTLIELDECMFYGNTIYRLLEGGSNVDTTFHDNKVSFNMPVFGSGAFRSIIGNYFKGNTTYALVAPGSCGDFGLNVVDGTES